MRYYGLDINGKIKGSYAVQQPNMVLHLLEDAPDEESKRNGVPGSAWVPDQDKIDARLAQEEQMEIEVLVNQKLKEFAIEELKKEGKLTANGKIKKQENIMGWGQVEG